MAHLLHMVVGRAEFAALFFSNVQTDVITIKWEWPLDLIAVSISCISSSRESMTYISAAAIVYEPGQLDHCGPFQPVELKLSKLLLAHIRTSSKRY